MQSTYLKMYSVGYPILEKAIASQFVQKLKHEVYYLVHKSSKTKSL